MMDLRNKGVVEWLGDSDREGNYKVTKTGLKIHKIYKKSLSQVEKILEKH